MHRQDVAYCGEIGCVIALQQHPPQCHILPSSRSGAQDVPRSLAECRALLRGYFTNSRGKSYETLQPKQLVNLEFAVVLLQAPSVRPLRAHGALPQQRPPCRQTFFLSLTETTLVFGISARALLMYLAAFLLVVSIAPECDVHDLQAPPQLCMPLLNLHEDRVGNMCDEPQR